MRRRFGRYPIPSREDNLFRKYGMSLRDYEEKFKRQDGRCAICSKEEIGRMLSVDHDHATGRVRGLLCTRCNLALGLIEDKGFIENAQRYLTAYAVIKK
jgi:Autographiviridae endonuclease VII